MRFHAALIPVVGLTLFLGGACSKSDSGAKPGQGASSGGNPLTAPVDYLGAAAKAQQKAAKTVTTAGLDQAIKMFYGQEGRYPKDLKELVPTYINAVPPPPANMKYDYDPKTGDFKIVPQ